MSNLNEAMSALTARANDLSCELEGLSLSFMATGNDRMAARLDAIAKGIAKATDDVYGAYVRDLSAQFQATNDLYATTIFRFLESAKAEGSNV